MKVTISRRALVQRMNRALAPRGLIRGTRGRNSERIWYCIDLTDNTARPTTLRGLERHALQMGVLKNHERVR